MINFSNALDLYLLMKPYLPEKQKLVPIDFIGEMIDNIRTANKPEDYLHIVSILQQVDVNTILEFSPEETLQFCVQGLVHNKIYELIDFFGEKLGL